MREDELLALIRERSAFIRENYAQVLVGPGDDCAVIEAPEQGALLLKVDQLVEHTHFTPQTPLDLVARKAIARAVSDIAAMAGTPMVSLAGAVLPRDYPQARADELYAALLRWSVAMGCPLVGGDTASHAGTDAPVTLSITIVGRAHATRGPVLRSGAKAGDLVYVTGTIGGSLQREASAEFPFPGGGRHLTFEPRLIEARELAAGLLDRLHAMMDISDGLGKDASRLAEASSVRIELEASLLPLTPGATDPQIAASQGEDYELLFCVDSAAPVPDTERKTGTAITCVGRVVAGSGCILRLPDGREVEAQTLGYEHT